MAAEESKMKNVVVDSKTGEQEEDHETKTGTHLGEESKMKNVVVDSRSSDHEKEEKETKTGTDLGLCLDKLSLGPKKKLLVIPLGGFIVHRAHVRDRYSTLPKNRRPDFCYGKFKIYKRPYCEEFLKFCFERFEVALWSSAMEHNIEAVLTQVIGEPRNKFLFTWDQKQCTKTSFMCLGSDYKPLFLKQLKYVWEKKFSSGEYSASNTLLISDPNKTILNPTYVKEHPFGEPAISASHPNWDFYSKVISSVGKEETSEDEVWDSDCSY